MINQKQQLVEDIKYIIQECERLQHQIQKQGLKNIPKEDWYFELPYPNNSSSKMICGRAAGELLNKITRNIAHQHGLARRVRPEKFEEIFAILMVNRFLRDKRPLNCQQIDRLISSTVKQAKTHCITVTHFIPCHLMRTKDPSELRIGPVNFHNRSSIRRIIIEKSRQRLNKQNTEQDSYARMLLYKAIRYYRKFQWVAEVEIKGCDHETSIDIAEKAVTSALDCLHLMLGARWTDQMQIHGPAMHMDHQAELYISSSSQLEASLSSSWIGQVNFEDGWSTELSSPEFANLIGLFAVALESAVDPELKRPLSQRFLDAAQWFGEASRDKSPSTRVVKYVTALERMVMTEEKNDISRFVSERVSAFCFEKPADREIWRKKVKKIYDLRSKLVHGSISPRSDEVWQGVYIGAELCEITLLRILHEFGSKGLRERDFSSKRLGIWFNRVSA